MHLDVYILSRKHVDPEQMSQYVEFDLGINPYKPSVLFVGHRQTVQTLIKGHILGPLIWVSTVCSQNVLLKFE